MNFKAALRHIRLFFLTLFDREITVYASSLSFYTIFTVVPLLIISLSLIANVPVFQDQYAKIQIFIFDNIMPVQTSAITGYLDSFFKNSVQLGIIGFATMIASSLLFFQNFEHIVGKIFKASKRRIWDAITTYWTLITLTPIVLIAWRSFSSICFSFIPAPFCLQFVHLLPFRCPLSTKTTVFSYKPLYVWRLGCYACTRAPNLFILLTFI